MSEKDQQAAKAWLAQALLKAGRPALGPGASRLVPLASVKNATCSDLLSDHGREAYLKYGRAECMPLLHFQLACLAVALLSSVILLARGKNSLRSAREGAEAVFQAISDLVRFVWFLLSYLPRKACQHRHCRCCARARRRRRGHTRSFSFASSTQGSSSLHDSGREMVSLTSVVTSEDERPLMTQLDRRQQAAKETPSDLLPVSAGPEA